MEKLRHANRGGTTARAGLKAQEPVRGPWGAMTFEIQWTGHHGAAMTHRDTPVEAIRVAIEMRGKDFTDVVIVDLANSGKTYAPTEFARLYKDANH